MAVSGYDLDDSDDPVALAVIDFVDGPVLETITESEVWRSFTYLRHFVESESLAGKFQEGRGEDSREFCVADDLRRRGRAITRYRLYLLSNRVLSSRAKDFASRRG